MWRRDEIAGKHFLCIYGKMSLWHMFILYATVEGRKKEKKSKGNIFRVSPKIFYMRVMGLPC